MPKSFDCDKFHAASQSMIQVAKDDATHNAANHYHEIRVLHLEAIRDAIFVSCGGKVAMGEFALTIVDSKSDAETILTFDAVDSFRDKAYSKKQLSSIDKGLYQISHIKNFMDGNPDYMSKFLSSKGLPKMDDDKLRSYCAYVAESSKKFSTSLMKWLVKESKINDAGYLADIRSSQDLDDDKLSVYDLIRLESSYAKGKVASAVVGVAPENARDLAATSGVKPSTAANPLTASAVLKDSRIVNTVR